MNLSEFKKKDIKELKEELSKVEKDMQKNVTDILQKKEKNVRKAGSLRKDIARIKTLLNQKLNEEKQ